MLIKPHKYDDHAIYFILLILLRAETVAEPPRSNVLPEKPISPEGMLYVYFFICLFAFIMYISNDPLHQTLSGRLGPFY